MPIGVPGAPGAVRRGRHRHPRRQAVRVEPKVLPPPPPRCWVLDGLYWRDRQTVRKSERGRVSGHETARCGGFPARLDGHPMHLHLQLGYRIVPVLSWCYTSVRSRGAPRADCLGSLMAGAGAGVGADTRAGGVAKGCVGGAGRGAMRVASFGADGSTGAAWVRR
jgi:hypothetical protein